MNIRIKELAEQAWDSLIDEMGDVVSEDGQLNSDFLHAYVQRFAELIVRECIKLAVPEDSYRDEWFKAKCDVMDRIKQHFGVNDEKPN